jgi:hypothetical protein
MLLNEKKVVGKKSKNGNNRKTLISPEQSNEGVESAKPIILDYPSLIFCKGEKPKGE